MSRTFRCKNYEQENNTSWDARGRKTAGFYTREEHIRDEQGLYWNFGNVEYHCPTDHERNKDYWHNHGDQSGSNTRSPGHEYRRNRMCQNRSINKQEIHRFMTQQDYEPMCEANPRSCLWDWR